MTIEVFLVVVAAFCLLTFLALYQWRLYYLLRTERISVVCEDIQRCRLSVCIGASGSILGLFVGVVFALVPMILTDDSRVNSWWWAIWVTIETVCVFLGIGVSALWSRRLSPP